MSVTQFFRAPPLQGKKPNANKVPNLSGQHFNNSERYGFGHCGLKAIAAGWLNLYASGKLKEALSLNNNPAVEGLLSRHRQYFPEQMPKQTTLSNQNIIAHLMARVDMPTLIATLAHSLHSYTIDTIHANISQYRNALPVELGSPLNKSTIAALAVTLDVCIQYKLDSKTLIQPQQTFNYTDTVPNNYIRIKQTDRGYFVELDDENISLLATTAVETVTLPNLSSGDEWTSEEISQHCAQSDSIVETNYMKYRAALEDALQKDPTLTQDLLSTYTSSITLESLVDGRQQCIDNACNDKRFGALVEQQQGDKQ